MTYIRPVVSSLCVALLLVGCNSNDNDNAATPFINTNSGSNNVGTFNTLNISPSLGKVLNAKVTLKNAKTNAILGTANTGSSGKVSFQVKKDVTHVIAEVTGEATSKYFDEATGEQPLPSSISLRVATPVVNNANVGVSFFTEAAVQHAEKLTDGLTKAANIDTANQLIASAVGISNILQAPVLIGANSDYNQLIDNAASAYALQLAGLVNAASARISSSNTPALEVLHKLAADLSDGIINGKNDTTTLTDLPYAPLASVFAASWQLAMQQIVNNLSNGVLKTAFTANVINKVDIKEINMGTVVTGDTDFGGSSKAPWKGEIYLLATNTPQLPDFNTLTPIGTLYTNKIDISLRSFTEPFPGVPSDRFEWFGVRYQGPLTITETGDYTFTTVSDDGSKLFIDDVLIVNNDGTHAQQSRSGTATNLKAGVHTLRVEYFQGPRTQIALQVYGHKVGSTSEILTPILPKAVIAEAVAAN